MMSDRSCAWMSGPRDAALKVSAAKWWLAISRDILVKGARKQMQMSVRSKAVCHRTPTFSSPISRSL
jgi:hypothetical protein